MRTAHRQTLNRTRQRGAALLVMLVLLITGGAYLLVSQLNRASGRIDAQKKTAAALAQAKEALIGWAVENMTTPGTPGMLPYPDRGNDGNYDGFSDCPATNFATTANLLLGKFPRIAPANPCPIPYTALGLDVVDGAGEVLWYAVSRNMVSALGVAPVINPDIMDTPPFPWLIVRDQTGAIINNRVAFVLIAPGPPLPGQNRSGAAPAPIQFLEGIGAVTNADSDGNYDGGVPACPSSMCEDFVMSDPWPSATAPTFNDRLLYVTIDELMPLIEKRVAREVRQALADHQTVHGSLPAPTAVGYVGSSCVAGRTNGFLPISACECRRTITAPGDTVLCNCHFDNTAPTPVSITYSHTGIGNYTTSTAPICTRPTLTSCRCIGAGSCSSSGPSPTHSFQCNEEGVCTARNTSTPPTYSITYTLPSSVTGSFTSVTEPPPSASCPTTAGATMTCSNFTQVQGVIGGCSQLLTGFPFSGFPGLPGWFYSNGWKRFMYYVIAPPALTVGTTSPVNALVISVGRPLVVGTPPTLQTRPSSILNHYLESPENGGAPTVFAGEGQPLTNIFNDQSVIVAP